MSAITKNYKVEYINFTSSYVFTSFTDITGFVVSLDDFVLQSTGKISTAKFTLNAEFGDFITNSNGGTTPLIKQFDLVRISIIGDDIGTLREPQSKIFEITTDLAQNASQSSYLLPLEAEGRERNLSGIPFGGFFRNETHDQMVTRIISSNNEQLVPGTNLQPAFVKSDDGDIPDFNPNIWDFTQVDNCYDALLEILESLNLPVSAGGGGNRYAMIFEDQYTSYPNTPLLTIMDIKIVKQGSVGAISTIQQNDDFPIISIDKIKQASTGSLVVARGRPKTSLQPQNYALFTSRLEFYRGIKQYDNTIAYPVGSHVSFGANVGGWPQKYLSSADTIPGTQPPSAPWAPLDVGFFIGDLQYSPFTVDKAGPIKNGFAHPDGTFDPSTIGAIAVPDHNLVINDVRGVGDAKIGTYRNWVYFRTNSPIRTDLTVSQRKYLKFVTGSEFGWYDGFTVLVDPNVGTLQGVFAGNDPNGVPFENNMAIFRAVSGASISDAGTAAAGDWFVIRRHEDFDQCAIYEEAIIYEFNVNFSTAQGSFVSPGTDRRRGGAGTTFEWRSIAGAFLGNDCFHTPISVQNVTGLVPSTLPDGEPLDDFFFVPYNEDSGIEIVFGYNQVDQNPTERDVWFKFLREIVTPDGFLEAFVINLAVTTYNIFTTPNYTNLGWWFAWPSPFPFSTHNAISEQVGDLYGGTTLTLNNHRYFDLFNIQYTTKGSQGWIHPDSSDLSEITGVQFLFNFDITVGGNRIAFTGDVPFAYWCIDKFGTVWKSQKKMYRHLGETQSISIEFGDLSPVFRGRTPLGIDNILEQIIVGEVEVNEVFFKENVIMQGFQCETPYDEYGRYSPNLFEQIIKPEFFDIFSGGGSEVRFIGVIDAFGFTKTPVAISASTELSEQRTIIPQFEDYQNIVNVEQLQRFADAKAQVESFPYEQYTITQGGIADVDLENTIALFDPFLINESDGGNDNTRNLAVRELHYSVPKDKALVRKIVAVKVIE